MIGLTLSLATRILSAVGSALGGIVLGLIIGAWVLIVILRRRIRNAFADNSIKIDDEDERKTIHRYVKNCEDSLTKTIKRKTKEKNSTFFIKSIVERIKAKKNAELPVVPPDEETPEEEVQNITFESKDWYPVYLMLHNIGVYYKGEDPLSFLEITEKELFEIVRKTTRSINRIFEVVKIDALKQVKCYTLMETLNMIMSIYQPLSKKGIINALKYSSQVYTDVMRVKSAFSINPFYYIRRFIKKKVTLEITLECIKCAVETVAFQILELYKGNA